MSDCEHAEFESTVTVNRLQDSPDAPISAYYADVIIRCAQCDEPFLFRGAGIGLRPDRPMTNVEQTEIRLPIVPKSAPRNFGMRLPGYGIKVVE